MEALGNVSKYLLTNASRRQSPEIAQRLFGINLSVGNMPPHVFIGGYEYYRVLAHLTNVDELTISLAFYRPRREEFEELDQVTQDQVLKGYLVHGELTMAMPMDDDPVETKWDFNRFQAWNLAAYGRRLPAEVAR